MSLTYQQRRALRWLVYVLALAYIAGGLLGSHIPLRGCAVLALVGGVAYALARGPRILIAVVFGAVASFYCGIYALWWTTVQMVNGHLLPRTPSVLRLAAPIHAVVVAVVLVWLLSKLPYTLAPASPRAGASRKPSADTGDSVAPTASMVAAAGTALPAGAATAAADAAIPGSQRRRGWQMPGQEARLESASPSGPEPPSAATQAAAGVPAPTMAGAVFGQVMSMEQGTVQRNQNSDPIVTLRLERNDPHAGRTFVSTLRLNGTDAVGFAAVGDWVEAVGARRSVHVLVDRGVNHTTGAVYENGESSLMPALRTIFIVVFVVAWLCIAFFVLSGGR